MQLLEVGYNAIVLHGAMDQTDRAGALEDFSNGVSQVSRQLISFLSL
jgi:superfamily II DNA/RNA helicase